MYSTELLQQLIEHRNESEFLLSHTIDLYQMMLDIGYGHDEASRIAVDDTLASLESIVDIRTHFELYPESIP